MLSGVPHSQAAAIPVDRQQRNPLMTEAGFQLLNRIRQHADAPRWNFEVGDRLLPEDLPSVEAFRQRVFAPRQYESHRPSSELLAWVQRMRDRIPLFRAHLPEGFNLARDWVYIPTTCREDIATRLDQWVPLDADLSRLIVYDTSGTTGHALVLPHHPVTVAEHHSLVEYGLDQYGLQAQFDFDHVACINVCAQAHTYVFATVFSIWNQAGFAKVNLKVSEWPQGMDSARRFFQDLSPQFLTGDPVAFAEMMRWQIPIRPLALISTAVALSPGLQQLLQEHFDCPVIDWYSSTETGPIAYANPNGEGMSLLPPDIYLEAVDEHGFPVAPGELGELTVTGGRNPYLPLLRYRTGDWGRLSYEPDGNGEVKLCLRDVRGRAPVFFRATDGSVVNPVDIGRIMRLHSAFVQHQFVQQADGACVVRIRPAPGAGVDVGTIEEKLRSLFGKDQPLTVVVDETLGNKGRSGKVIPYRTELSF